jgi:AraC family transcriptional regulator
VGSFLAIPQCFLLDYINDHLDQDLGLEKLAAIAQLSQYHFSRIFKHSTGMSPHQYVIQQRVERAKLLLREKKMGICEVAIVCGFTHQSHLNLHLKRLLSIASNFLKSYQLSVRFSWVMDLYLD